MSAGGELDYRAAYVFRTGTFHDTALTPRNPLRTCPMPARRRRQAMESGATKAARTAREGLKRD